MDFNFSEQISSRSDDELVAICVNHAQYRPSFVQLAREELSNRKVSLSPVEALKSQADSMSENKLTEGEPGNSLWMMLCAVSALLGGFIGIIGGYIYAYSKKTSPSGKKYFAYNLQTRKRGRIIFFVSIGISIATSVIATLSH